MPKFGAQSKAALAQAHPELQRLFAEVIKEIDCKVLDATRGKAAQELAFNKGNSKAHFGESPHNYVPAIALDVVPWPLDWDDLKSFRALGKVVKAKAVELDIPISWGGDWKSFKDYPHYELSPWRTWAKKSKLVVGDGKPKTVVKVVEKIVAVPTPLPPPTAPEVPAAPQNFWVRLLLAIARLFKR